MSTKRTYVKHEVVLYNPSLGCEKILYAGPSRTALPFYNIIRDAFSIMDVPADSYVLTVRLCL